MTVLKDPVKNLAKAADVDGSGYLEVWTSVRDGGVDGILTDTPVRTPITSAGIETPDLVPGPAFFRLKLGSMRQSIEGRITIPPTGPARVMDVIAASILIPPDTPAQLVVQAVQSYLAANPVEGGGLSVEQIAQAASTTSPLKAALDQSYAPLWRPSTVYAAGAPVILPNSKTATRTANGTSRAQFDATEEALWTVTAGGLAKSEADNYYPPLGDYTKPSGDSRVGILNWAQDSATGYLLHLTVGPNSGVANAAMAIGTDRGNASGLLISHKNSGRGIDLGVQPGAGSGMQITARSAVGFPLRALLKPGSLPISLRAEKGAGFADGVTTAGSPNFSSATAAFTAADVGKTISQLTSRGPSDPAGTIPAGTTIQSVTSGTAVVLSANATATVAALLFEVGDRLVGDAQSLLSVQDENSATLTTLSKQGVNIKGSNVAFPPLRVSRKAGQTSPILEVRDEASALLSFFGKSGHISTTVKTALTSADLSNSTVGMYIDDTPGAQKLILAGKDSGGSVAFGSVPIGPDRTKRRGSLSTGKYYGIFGVSTQATTPTQDRARLHEFYLDDDTTIDRIGTEVTTVAAGSTLRWVIYRDNNGYPGALVLDTGAVGDSATAVGFQEATINQTLTAGRYWLGCIAQGGNPALRSTQASIATPAAGLTAAEVVSQTGAGVGYRADGISGAAPATFTASAPSTAFAPMVWVRKAA
ncbi:hypothetical protein [Rhodococcoides fascians]|uniref:hypothetical protein n=1 Tax=Rhodococcoides fascians TaxID=1828 RepID=UPI00068F3290|nr:hypothetical protein [Rhodococcus fascians]